MASTNTLQRSINVASQFLRLAPLTLVGGISNEPAFSFGDYVRQLILSPPFAWRWNRSQTAFLAQQGVQDYALVNWSSNTQFVQGMILIDPNGNQQQAGTTGVSGPGAPGWSQTVQGVTVDNTVNWICAGPVGTTGISPPGPVYTTPTPINNFGWLEKATIVDQNGQAYELPIQLNLSLESQQNQPNSIATLSDNDGLAPTLAPAITFRLSPAPDKTYLVNLTYQQAALSFTDITGTWSPIPDYLFYLYNQGVMAKAYEYFGDERFAFSQQMFLRQVLAVSEGLTDSQKNIWLAEKIDSEREAQAQLGNSASGRAGRGMFNA